MTQLWERIAPFPDGGRSYTRNLLIDELCAAEDRGEGWLTHTRRGGVAVAPSRDAARTWFTHLHFKDLPALVNGPNGATGEDFLGYSHGPALYSTIQRGLAQLIAEQAVRAVDGARFEQQRDVRRSLIAAFNGP